MLFIESLFDIFFWVPLPVSFPWRAFRSLSEIPGRTWIEFPVIAGQKSGHEMGHGERQLERMDGWSRLWWLWIFFFYFFRQLNKNQTDCQPYLTNAKSVENLAPSWGRWRGNQPMPMPSRRVEKEWWQTVGLIDWWALSNWNCISPRASPHPIRIPIPIPNSLADPLGSGSIPDAIRFGFLCLALMLIECLPSGSLSFGPHPPVSQSKILLLPNEDEVGSPHKMENTVY